MKAEIISIGTELLFGQIVDTTYVRDDLQGYVANPLYVLSYDFYALARAT